MQSVINHEVEAAAEFASQLLKALRIALVDEVGPVMVGVNQAATIDICAVHLGSRKVVAPAREGSARSVIHRHPTLCGRVIDSDSDLEQSHVDPAKIPENLRVNVLIATGIWP
jgi:hypothetical protein